MTPSTPNKIADALRDEHVSCEITKRSVVHCKYHGVDILLATVAAPMGTQLILAVPFKQPACAGGSYHERLSAFNANYSLATAGCLNNKVLLVSHRTHLFRAGFDRAELRSIVTHWVEAVVMTVKGAGLLDTYELPAEPPPKAKSKKPSPEGGTI